MDTGAVGIEKVAVHNTVSAGEEIKIQIVASENGGQLH